MERKLKSLLLSYLKCRDSGIHWKNPPGFFHLDSVMLIIKSVRYCADKLEKSLFPLILPHLLLYSAHVRCCTGTPSRLHCFLTSLIQITRFRDPKEFIQTYLFAVPEVFPCVFFSGIACCTDSTCWGARGAQEVMLPGFSYEESAVFSGLSGMVCRDVLGCSS